MIAAVTYGDHDIRVEEYHTPAPGAGQALIRVRSAGICGGDIRIYKGLFPYANFPLINGHEFAGDIVELGDGVATLAVGDRVLVDPILPCGQCYACKIGKPNCCHNLRVTGVHVNGAFAQYIAVPAERIHKMPDTMSYELGSLVEPYAIAMHSSNLVGIGPEDTVVIIGAGPIGAAACDVAKARGATVVLAELQPERLAHAARYSPDVTVNTAEEDLQARVMELTGGYGAPVVLEATGVPAVMASTQDLVANGGRIGLVGVTSGDVTFNGLNFSKKEMSIFGSRNSRGVFPQLIEMVSKGQLHPEGLVTHRFKLADIGQAMETADRHANAVCKILLEV